MTKTRITWILIALVVLTAGALLIPGSPFYLTKVRKPDLEVDGKNKSYWVENLDNPDRQIRLDAIRAMGLFGPEARETVPTLAKLMLEDSEAIVRNEAALTLSKMFAPEAVPALAQALEDKEASVRLNACVALSRLRKEARPALPALIKALKAEENDTNANLFHFTIQEMAALSIGRATAGTADGVPALLDALAVARTSTMRQSLARAFGEIGSEALSAVPHLRKLIKNADRQLKQAIAEAFIAIGVDPTDDKVQNKTTGAAP